MCRDANGQFAKGNPGGPGRPPRATEADYLAALTEMVTIEDFQKIVARALSDAIAGDYRARDYLTKYLIGDRLPPDAGQSDGEQIIRIVRDDDFYGNADMIAAHSTPEWLAHHDKVLQNMFDTIPWTKEIEERRLRQADERKS